MDFTAFDTKKLDEYAAKAKQQWGATAAYQEYETKNAHETTQTQQGNARALMALVAAFGHMQTKDPADPAVQAQVQKEILGSLGQMYGAGGEFTANINAAGSPGAAEFARKAIERYCCG